MTPATHLLTRTIYTAGAILSATVLALGFVYLGYSIQRSSMFEAKGVIEAARYEELEARHKTLEALYGSVRWAAVIEAANDKALKAEKKLAIVCKKVKAKVCI